MTTPLPSARLRAVPLPPVGLEEARERAVRLLSDGYAYDRLSETEFEWRIDRLISSSTPAAIDSLVADLVGPAGSPAPAPLLPEEERRILALMSNTRHGGVWRVPPRLHLVAVMSEVRIDLRQATLPSSCTIEVLALMANVQVIVPPGLPVHYDVGAVLASTRNDAVPVDPHRAGLPHVTVRGFALMSEVRVRVRARG